MLTADGAFVQKLRGESVSLTRWTEDFFKSNPDEANPRAEANLYPDLPPHLSSDPNHVSSQTEPYFWGISSVVLDREERLYVVEYRRHRFQVYQKA